MWEMRNFWLARWSTCAFLRTRRERPICLCWMWGRDPVDKPVHAVCGRQEGASSIIHVCRGPWPRRRVDEGLSPGAGGGGSQGGGGRVWGPYGRIAGGWRAIHPVSGYRGSRRRIRPRYHGRLGQRSYGRYHGRREEWCLVIVDKCPSSYSGGYPDYHTHTGRCGHAHGTAAD